MVPSLSTDFPQALGPDKAVSVPAEVSDEMLDKVQSMGNFGERLQREREMRSITLQEISNSTKISTRMLKALEDEDFARLPGGIFNKGFVRAYCRFLGIDEEQAVADYLAALAENEKKTPESAKSSNQVSDNLQPSLFGPQFDRQNRIQLVEPQGHSFDLSQHLVTATVVLVVLLGGAGLAKYFYDRNDVVSAKTSSTAPIIAEPAPAIAPATNTSVDTATPSDQPGSISPEKSSPTVSQQVSANDSAAASLASTKPGAVNVSANTHPDSGKTTMVRSSSKVTSAPALNITSESDTTNVSVSGVIHVQIHAREDSWARITGDGKLLMEGVIKANMDKSFRTTEHMVVTLGNAGAVDMAYNGKSLPSFAPEAKYKQLVFGHNGSPRL